MIHGKEKGSWFGLPCSPRAPAGWDPLLIKISQGTFLHVPSLLHTGNTDTVNAQAPLSSAGRSRSESPSKQGTRLWSSLLNGCKGTVPLVWGQIHHPDCICIRWVEVGLHPLCRAPQGRKVSRQGSARKDGAITTEPESNSQVPPPPCVLASEPRGSST